MFTDARSKKVVLVAHCILNQNAKMDRCAFYPGAVREVSEMLVAAGVGLLQMPCPELLCFGLAREADPAIEPTIGEEDTRIARRLHDADAQATCRRLVDDLVYQVEEYAQNGFEVIGILGMNGSPSCAVELTWYEDAAHPEPGQFVAMLRDALADRGFVIPMAGIRANEPEAAVHTVEALLARV